MSSSSKKTSISPLNPNITTWNPGKQHKSQPDSDNNNTDIIKISTSDSSSHHTEIHVMYLEFPIPMITKDHFHWQSLLEFSCEQLKDNLIQPKLDTIINQINDQLAADFYELMAAW